MNGSTGVRLAQGVGRARSVVLLTKRLTRSTEMLVALKSALCGHVELACKAGVTVAGGRPEPRFGEVTAVLR